VVARRRAEVAASAGAAGADPVAEVGAEALAGAEVAVEEAEVVAVVEEAAMVAAADIDRSEVKLCQQ
jgi:hypothetical protein